MMRILGTTVWLAAAGGLAAKCGGSGVAEVESATVEKEIVDDAALDPPCASRVPATIPGSAGPRGETCDGVDDDGDGRADEGLWRRVAGPPVEDPETLGGAVSGTPWLGALDSAWVGRGGTWVPVPLPASGHPYAWWAAGVDDVWAAGHDGVLRHFDGAAWSAAPGDGPALRAVWGSGTADVWAVGDEGVLRHFDGAAWRTVAAPGATSLRAVHGTGPADVWAAGDGGVLLHFDGSSWRRIPSGTTAGLRDVWCAAPDDAWSVGAAGTILHWDGARWSPVEAPIDAGLAAIDGRAPDDVTVVGSEGTILHWDGTAWTDATNPCPPVRSLSDVRVFADGSAWAVGSCGVLRRP